MTDNKFTKNFKSTGIIVSLVMLFSKVFGMLRDIILAAMYGTATVEAISFSTASRIPLLFFDIALGTAVTSAFIPIYNEYIAKDDRKSADAFANRFMVLVFIITFFMALIGIIFSDVFVEVIASGLNSEQSYLASLLVKILFPVIIFTGIAFCIVGVLQSEGNFVIPALISLVSNGFLILYLLIFKNRFGIHGVAVAMLVGWFLQVVIQLPSLKKSTYTFKLKNPFGDEAIKRVCLLSLPIIISAWVQPINTMINIRLASGLNGGEAITSLDYANKLYIILVGVVAYTITNLTFPSISRLASLNDYENFGKMVNKSIIYAVMIIAPIMAGFMVLSTPIIRLFYERGMFSETSTKLTSLALMCYSTGMIGYALTEIMNKSFYSLKNGKTPMIVSCLGIGINIVLSLVCINVIKTDLRGLAISASVASNLIGITMLYLLNKKVGHIINKNLLISLIKIIIAVIVMVLVVVQVNWYLPLNANKIIAVAVPALSGAVVYAIMCLILKIEAFTSLIRIFDKFKKQEG